MRINAHYFASVEGLLEENPLNILKYWWFDISFQEYLYFIVLVGSLRSSCATLWKAWWPEALPDLRERIAKGDRVSRDTELTLPTPNQRRSSTALWRSQAKLKKSVER